jgi:hypothetical protein
MLEVGSKFFSPDSWRKVGLVPTNHEKRIPNGCLLIGWMLLAAMLWVQKFQLCSILDNTKDILSITGTETNHMKRWESLFDIGQHKRYFTDYRNQNKSYQKMRKFQLCLILDNTKDIFLITEPKTNHPKRWDWLVEEETPFPTNTRHQY